VGAVDRQLRCAPWRQLTSVVSRKEPEHKEKNMKHLKLFMIIVIMTNLIGCASTGFLMAKPKVTLYGQTYPAKDPDEQVDVFNTYKPDREYTEIAQITCGDTDDSWSMKQILIKAREIGADAIIITGRSGSYGVGVPIGNMAYAVAEGYGISAIAIKYK